MAEVVKQKKKKVVEDTRDVRTRLRETIPEALSIYENSTSEEKKTGQMFTTTSMWFGTLKILNEPERYPMEPCQELHFDLDDYRFCVKCQKHAGWEDLLAAVNQQVTEFLEEARKQ